MPIFALYNFDDTGLDSRDSALSNGAQDGAYFDGAAPLAGVRFWMVSTIKLRFTQILSFNSHTGNT